MVPTANLDEDAALVAAEAGDSSGVDGGLPGQHAPKSGGGGKGGTELQTRSAEYRRRAKQRRTEEKRRRAEAKEALRVRQARVNSDTKH